MTKIFKLFLCCLLLCATFSLNFKNENVVKAAESIDKTIQERISEYEFIPNDIKRFDSLPEETIIACFEGYFITKGDLIVNKSFKNDSEIKYTVDVSELKDSKPYSKEGLRASETYVSLPKGCYSATTEWKVIAPSFEQTVYTMYLTKNGANAYLVSKWNTKPGSILTKWTFDAIIAAALKNVGYAGAAYTIINLVGSLLDFSYYNQIKQLTVANKKVEIRVGRNNYGRFRAVFEWDGKKVRVRRGTGMTTETTKYNFSKAK